MNNAAKTNNDAASEQASLFFFSFSFSFVRVKFLSRDELTGEGVNCQTNPPTKVARIKVNKVDGHWIVLSGSR